MVKMENHLGVIDISHEYLTNLVGVAATSCFGVAGMSTAGTSQTLFSKIFPNDRPEKGIKVRCQKGKLLIDIRIIVTYGTNISAIVKSIMNKVRFTVEETTGFEVAKVNVFVDGMKTQ